MDAFERLYTEIDAAWEKATDQDKLDASKWATETIDRFEFKGSKLDQAQLGSWPRRGVVEKSGRPITGIPRQIGRATYLLAGARLAGRLANGLDPQRDQEFLLYVRLVLEPLLAEISQDDKASTLH